MKKTEIIIIIIIKIIKRLERGISDTKLLRIISKSYAHLQIMTEIPVQFQIDRYKTVDEVADTRYPLPIRTL